jgi:hypothetical protein
LPAASAGGAKPQNPADAAAGNEPLQWLNFG